MVYTKEKISYWLDCLHCEYFRARRFKNVAFLIKTTSLSKLTFEMWAWPVDTCFKLCLVLQIFMACMIKMVLLDLLAPIVNIWALKDWKMFFKQNNLLQQTQLWKVGLISVKFCLVFQRGMLCKIKNAFIDFFNFIAIILGLKDLKILFSGKNNYLEQTLFWGVSMVNLKFCLLLETCMVRQIEKGFYWIVYFHCKYLQA